MRTLAEGLRLYQDEKYEEAARRLQVVVEFEPDNVQAWMYYGAVLGKLGHWPHAVAAFERVVALQPDQASGYFNLAHARVEDGDAIGAELAVAHALALEPNNPEVELLHQRVQAVLHPAAPAPPVASPVPEPSQRPPRRVLPALLAILAILLVVTAVVVYRGASQDVRRLRRAAALLDEAMLEERRLQRVTGEDFDLTNRARQLRDEAELLLQVHRGTAPAELYWLRGRLLWERDRNAGLALPHLTRASQMLENEPAEKPRPTGESLVEVRAAVHRALAWIGIDGALRGPAEAADEAAEHARAAAGLAPSADDAALNQALAEARQRVARARASGRAGAGPPDRTSPRGP